MLARLGRYLPWPQCLCLLLLGCQFGRVPPALSLPVLVCLQGSPSLNGLRLGTQCAVEQVHVLRPGASTATATVHHSSVGETRTREGDTGTAMYLAGWQGLRQAGSLQNVTSGAWRSSLCAGAAQLHCTTGRPTSFRGMRSPKQWGASPRNPAGAVAYSPSAQPITSLNTPSGPG